MYPFCAFSHAFVRYRSLFFLRINLKVKTMPMNDKTMTLIDKTMPLSVKTTSWF